MIINVKIKNKKLNQWFKKIIIRKIRIKLLLSHKIYFEFVNFI